MKRRAFIGSVCVFVVSVGLMASVLVLIHDGYEGRMAEIAALRERHSQLVDRRKDVEALAQRRDALAAVDPETYGVAVAETLDVARAEVQAQVQEIALEVGATLSRIGPARGDLEDAAAVSASLRIDADRLPEFLARLANSQPAIFVRELDIEAPRSRARGDAPTDLDLRLVVFSYVSLSSAGEKP